MSGSNPINSGVVDPLVDSALAGIAAAADLASLIAARSSLIGEASEISKLNASIKNMPNEFKGPMTAILDEGPSKSKIVSGAQSAYGALMTLKGKAMTAILNSPLIHNEVVWSKVAEAAAKLEAPKDVPLKDPKQWKLIGKPAKRLDLDGLAWQHGRRNVGALDDRHDQDRKSVV